MQKVWLKSYPTDVPEEIDGSAYPSLVALLEESVKRHADRIAQEQCRQDLTARAKGFLVCPSPGKQNTQSRLSRGEFRNSIRKCEPARRLDTTVFNRDFLSIMHPEFLK